MLQRLALSGILIEVTQEIPSIFSLELLISNSPSTSSYVTHWVSVVYAGPLCSVRVFSVVWHAHCVLPEVLQ